MKLFLPILLWLLHCISCLYGKKAFAQVKDSTAVYKNTKPGADTIKSTDPKNYKPEIFTSGFIDIINNGEVNASARFIRLLIDEPGKFS